MRLFKRGPGDVGGARGRHDRRPRSRCALVPDAGPAACAKSSLPLVACGLLFAAACRGSRRTGRALADVARRFALRRSAIAAIVVARARHVRRRGARRMVDRRREPPRPAGVTRTTSRASIHGRHLRDRHPRLVAGDVRAVRRAVRRRVAPGAAFAASWQGVRAATRCRCSPTPRVARAAGVRLGDDGARARARAAAVGRRRSTPRGRTFSGSAMRRDACRRCDVARYSGRAQREALRNRGSTSARQRRRPSVTRAPGGPRRHHATTARHARRRPAPPPRPCRRDDCAPSRSTPSACAASSHRIAIADALHAAANDEPPRDHAINARVRRT